MGLQRFPYVDFSGGINLRDNAAGLEDNESQNERNVTRNSKGLIGQRKGKSRIDVSGFPASKRAEHMRNWYTSSGRLLMLSIDGTVYSMDTSGALTSRFAGTAGKVWCFEAMLDSGGADKIWMMNGTDTPKKMDPGGTVTNWANSPPNGTMLKVWKNKMIISGVAANPMRLFWSNIADPENPAAAYGTNWIDIKSSEDDQDPITWIDTCQDALIVFKRRSVWMVFEAVNFTNVRLGKPGCEGRFQSVELYGALFYMCRDGIYSVQPNSEPRYESSKIGPIFSGTSNPVGAINTAAFDACRMAASRDRRLLLAIPLGSNTTPNLLIEGVPELRGVQHVSGRRVLSDMPYSLHDIPCSSLATFRQVTTDDVVAGAGDAAKVHRIFSGLNDDGVAIDSFFFGAWRSLISEEPLERLRRINVEHQGRLTIDLFRDFNVQAPIYSKELIQKVDQPLEWDDTLPWDDGLPWDPSAATGLSRARPEKRGRYHALMVRNNVKDESWILYTIEFAFRGGKEHVTGIGDRA